MKHPPSLPYRLLFALGAATVTFWVQAANPPSSSGPAPTEDRVGFPAGYREKFTVIRTQNRAPKKQLVTVYANTPAASISSQDKLPYPYGSVLVMETSDTLKDADGKPLLDEQGRFRGSEVVSLHVMRREKDFGAAYGPNRTGEWEYVEYRADGSHLTAPAQSAACATCHVKAGAARDWVYRGRFPAAETMK